MKKADREKKKAEEFIAKAIEKARQKGIHSLCDHGWDCSTCN